jgi:hypothetical protein
MKHPFRSALRWFAAKVLPDSSRLRHIAYRPKLETWIKSREHENYPRFESRFEIYEFVNREIVSGKPILYLEFGVFQGESLGHFARINTHASSRFVGFDTFTGLPEEWDHQLFHTVGKQTFDLGGKLPNFSDPRITLVKGLFQDTLPGFLRQLEPSAQLVVHVDSDLYSSALYVLTFLNAIMVPGTVIIFDEFFSALHEFRALEDYSSSYVRSYKVVAATKGHGQIAIRML